MANFTPLDQTFKGFAQDVSRDQLSKGVLWRMADLIPDLEAPARKRGGWVYQNSAAGSGYMSGMGYFRKTTGVDEQLITIDSSGRVYKDALTGAVPAGVGSMASSLPLKHAPFYYLGNLIIIDGNRGIKRWTGTTLTSAATGYKVGCAWGDFIILGNTAADATLLAWGISPAGVLAGSTWNLPGEIVGVAGLPRTVLVFGYSDVWAILGDNPPPGGNMRQQTLYSGYGLADQRSLINTGAAVIWANTTGIYLTSGSEPQPLDLTERGGISRFWQELMSSFDLAAGWCAAATTFKNWYIISVTDNNLNSVATLACDLQSFRWIELTNIGARAFAHAPGASASSEECYFGRTSESRAAKLSTLWTPGAPSLAYDGDGDPVLPYLETTFYRIAGFGEERIRNVLVSYDLRASSGAPYLNVGFVTSPESTDYTVSGRTLPATTLQDRKIADIRRKARGLGIKVALASAADDLKLYGLETEGHTVFEKR